MDKEQVKATFDQMAESYDEIWGKLQPFNNALYLAMNSMLAGLPSNAHILVVGAGTGTEIIELATYFPKWTFTALDPSDAMMNVCKKKIQAAGLESRCEFRVGYIEDMAEINKYDAATALLVSQFMTDQDERTAFFKHIARSLKPSGVFINTDLSGDVKTQSYLELLKCWFRVLQGAELTPEMFDILKSAYEHDLGIIAEPQLIALLQNAGFQQSIRFYQVGLIHGWCSTKA